MIVIYSLITAFLEINVIVTVLKDCLHLSIITLENTMNNTNNNIIQYNPSDGFSIFAIVMAFIFTFLGVFGNSITIICFYFRELLKNYALKYFLIFYPKKIKINAIL